MKAPRRARLTTRLTSLADQRRAGRARVPLPGMREARVRRRL